MSTQPTNSIPFTANHTQQAFKLLELPPELLSLLESDNPPTLQISASSHPPHHAHLTISNSISNSASNTPSNSNNILKTYTLRQKNTSNPLMLLSPSIQKIPESQQDQALSSPSSPSFTTQPSITRISSVEQTIELLEVELELELELEQDEDQEQEGKENAKPKPKPKPKEKPVKQNKWHEKFAQSRGSGTK